MSAILPTFRGAAALLALITWLPAAGAELQVVTYTYDANGRLTGARYDGTTKELFEYDASGNILRRIVGTGPAGPVRPLVQGSHAGPELLWAHHRGWGLGADLCGRRDAVRAFFARGSTHPGFGRHGAAPFLAAPFLPADDAVGRVAGTWRSGPFPGSRAGAALVDSGRREDASTGARPAIALRVLGPG